jgi:hypothetical protein
MTQLPHLESKLLAATRNYLRDVTLAMGSLQRAFLPANPHDWQHGLEVTMRGISTQAFEANDKEERAILDFMKNEIRLDGKRWSLGESSGKEIFEQFKTWAETKNTEAVLEVPEFMGGKFDADQCSKYAHALWWMDEQFKDIKAGLSTGLAAPVLLYPHHFDLSLVWFPHDDQKQAGLGFSTGDEIVAEPYLYLTLYPEADFAKYIQDRLPSEAYWQAEGFSGGVLPYAKLQAAESPEELLASFVGPTLANVVANGF